MPKEEMVTVNGTELVRPRVKLLGNDGNAFAILGACGSATRKAGWSRESWDFVRNKMTSGDYDNLLATAMDYFIVE